MDAMDAKHQRMIFASRIIPAPKRDTLIHRHKFPSSPLARGHIKHANLRPSGHSEPLRIGGPTLATLLLQLFMNKNGAVTPTPRSGHTDLLML